MLRRGKDQSQELSSTRIVTRDWQNYFPDYKNFAPSFSTCLCFGKQSEDGSFGGAGIFCDRSGAGLFR